MLGFWLASILWYPIDVLLKHGNAIINLVDVIVCYVYDNLAKHGGVHRQHIYN